MRMAVFGQFLGKVLRDNTLKCYMHVAPQSVHITIDASRPQMDVHCFCARCGVGRSGKQRWTPATMPEGRQWPTFNYANANVFLTKKQRKEVTKERRKGKAVRGTCSTRQSEETNVIVVSNCAQDLAASFDIGPVSDPGKVETQPIRVAKVHGRFAVDANNSAKPDTATSDSSCKSSSVASESRSRTDKDASRIQPPPPSCRSTSETPFWSNRL